MHVLVATIGMMFGASEPVMENLYLRSGHMIRGEVLRERDQSLVVDIGVEVLIIPEKAVERRETGTQTSVTVQTGRRFGESGNLYATADFPTAPLKELVDRFGESVVQVRTPSGSGSGFLVDTAGHCITNFHVIERETDITVDLFLKAGNAIVEKSVDDVQIVALNPFYDLALLKLPPKEGVEYKRAYLGFTSEARQGEIAFAIGNPLGLTRSVTQGIISNTNRNVSGQLYLQTTAQINPGNSGGPLFNQRGQVIGVTNMRATFGEGVGFAIPVSYVKDFLAHREAFAYNKDNPNTGYHYLPPPRRRQPLNASGNED